MSNMTNEIVQEFIQVLNDEDLTLDNFTREDTEFIIRSLVKYSRNNQQIGINADAFLNDLTQKLKK